MVFWLWLFLIGFAFGALFVISLEGLGLIFVLNQLKKKKNKNKTNTKTREEQEEEEEDALAQQSLQSKSQQSLVDLASNKQGVIWVLEPDKVPKEQKRKKELLEVSPTRRHAKIKDRSLLLTEPDGSHTSIQLKNCVIEAVSATTLSSKKWAKKLPIKVESKNSAIYSGSKILYIYLETSWEKESWCKALRLASCEDEKRLDWFAKVNEEFHGYLTSLNTGYPSFMKPSVGFHAEPVDRATRNDGSSSKVRLLWKKLSKKAGKINAESKAGWTSSSGREERKIIEKFRPSQDSGLTSGSVKTASTVKVPNSSMEENVVLPSSSAFAHSGSQSHISVISDADSDDRFNIDEGTLCWNLLISRLFFDAKSNAETKKFVQARIQRTLSNMRTPNYIGEIICTDIDLGNVPPYIHGMRVLPMDMNEVWAFEVDFEYSGGVVLSVETRLEVRELDLQKGIVDTNSESSAVGDFSSDLLEEIECYGKQLNLSDETVDQLVQKDEGELKHDPKGSKSSTSASTSKWKSILNSIAKQVSQVPISLAIRVASLRGTVRLHIKPPPSDQLWIGFTSMPDIDFNLESSVGDHKITNGHIALFLISRFKAAIRETLVLPNCETVCIPFMLAEKDDWIPSKAAPFVWLNQEVLSDPTPMREAPAQPGLSKTKTEASRGTSNEHPESKHQKREQVECVQQPISRPSGANTILPSSTNPLLQSKSFQELKTPLLGGDNHQETFRDNGEEISESQSSSESLLLSERSLSFNHTIEEDDPRPKRWGRKARMLDIGKKMGEKLEEKRRHIEERGRHIVEKMRGP